MYRNFEFAAFWDLDWFHAEATWAKPGNPWPGQAFATSWWPGALAMYWPSRGDETAYRFTYHWRFSWAHFFVWIEFVCHLFFTWTRPPCRNAEALGVLMANLVDAGGYGDPQHPRHGQWHPLWHPFLGICYEFPQVTSTSLWTTVIWTTLPWTHLAMSLAQSTWDDGSNKPSTSEKKGWYS